MPTATNRPHRRHFLVADPCNDPIASIPAAGLPPPSAFPLATHPPMGGVMWLNRLSFMNDQQLVCPVACQWFPRFGKMRRNFSIDLRRFRWQAQKA